MTYFVYVLVNGEGQTYVGQTVDLERRIAEHNDRSHRGSLHNKRRAGRWPLVYSEASASRAEAMKRERQLKSGGGRRFIRQFLDRRVHRTGGC